MRTSTVAQKELIHLIKVRGLISEYGIIMPKGAAAFRRPYPKYRERWKPAVLYIKKAYPHTQYERYLYIGEQVKWFDDKLNQTIKQFENAGDSCLFQALGLTSQAVCGIEAAPD